MAWTVRLSPEAERQLKKTGTAEALRITRFLHERLAAREDPRELGKALTGPLKEYWRYRVGDYRIICSIKNNIMTVLVVQIAHRSIVYRQR